MKVSESGLQMIRNFEGLRLTAYRDAAGVWTIGYGSTGAAITEGMTITREKAEELLRRDVERFERAVTRLVKVPLTQNQFDALVSFVFNVGLGAFQKSNLLRRLNLGDYSGAATEFKKWVYAGGRVLEGLRRRRKAESDLFLRPDK